MPRDVRRLGDMPAPPGAPPGAGALSGGPGPGPGPGDVEEEARARRGALRAQAVEDAIERFALMEGAHAGLGAQAPADDGALGSDAGPAFDTGTLPEDRELFWRRLVRGDVLSGMSVGEKQETIARLAARLSPEFASLPYHAQVAIADDLLEEHTQGWGEWFASWVPVYGPAAEAYADPGSLPKYLGAVMGIGPAGAEMPPVPPVVLSDDLLRVLADMDEEPAPAQTGFERRPLTNAVTRVDAAYAAAAADLMLFATATRLGSAALSALGKTSIGGKVLGKIGLGASGTSLAEQAAQKALGLTGPRLVAQEAAVLGTQAASLAVKQKIAQGAVHGLSTGEFFSLGHAAMRGELHPLEDLVVHPLFFAGLGAAFTGAGMGIQGAYRRLGRVETKLLDGLMSIEGMASEGRAAQTFANALRGAPGVESPGDTVLRGLANMLSREEGLAIKEVMLKRPELMNSAVGQRLLKTVYPKAGPVIQVVEGAEELRLVLEKVGSREIERPLARSVEDLYEPLRRLAKGEVALIEASGPRELVQPFEAWRPLEAPPPLPIEGVVRSAVTREDVPLRFLREIDRESREVLGQRASRLRSEERTFREALKEWDAFLGEPEILATGKRPGGKFATRGETQAARELLGLSATVPSAPSPSTQGGLREIASREKATLAAEATSRAQEATVLERALASDTLLGLSPGQAIRSGSSSAIYMTADPRGLVTRWEGVNVTGITTRLSDGSVVNIFEIPKGARLVSEALSPAAESTLRYARSVLTDAQGRRWLTRPSSPGNLELLEHASGARLELPVDAVLDATRRGLLNMRSWRALEELSDAALIGKTRSLVERASLDPFEPTGRVRTSLQEHVLEIQRRVGGSEIAPYASLFERSGSLERLFAQLGSPEPPSGPLSPVTSPVLSFQAAASGTRIGTIGGRYVMERETPFGPMRAVFESAGALERGLQRVLRRQQEVQRLDSLVGRAIEGRAKGEGLPLVPVSSSLGAVKDIEPTLKLFAEMTGDRVYQGRGIGLELGNAEPGALSSLFLAGSALRRMGPLGAELFARFKRMDLVEDRAMGRWRTMMDEIKALVPKEMRVPQQGEKVSKFVRFLERNADDPLGEPYVPASPDEAARLLRAEALHKKLTQEVYNTVEFQGGKMKPQLEGYVPHMLDWAALSDASSGMYESTVSQIRSLGYPVEKAREMISRSLRRFTERLAGNLEIERMPRVTAPYVGDYDRLMEVYLRRGAKRAAELHALGPKDEAFHRILGELAKQYGAQSDAVEFTKRVFDFQVGINKGMSAESQGFLSPGNLVKLNQARLSMSWAVNAIGQTVNTSVVAGLWNTIKAAFAGTKGVLAQRGEHARRAGALTHTLVDTFDESDLIGSLLGYRAENRVLARRMVEGSVKTGTLVFALSEMWNREVATRAGEMWFDEAVGMIRKGDPKGLGRARLGELGLNTERMVSAVVRGDAEALDVGRSLAGKFASDTSQFRYSTMTMPLASQDPWMRLMLFQFKSFGYNQSRFMLDTLQQGFSRGASPAKRERALRMLGALALAFPSAGLVTSKVNAFFTGVKQPQEAWEDFANTPEASRALAAWITSTAYAGGLGFLGDALLGVATLDRNFADRNIGSPPALAMLEEIGGASLAALSVLESGSPTEAASGAAARLAPFAGGAGRAALAEASGVTLNDRLDAASRGPFRPRKRPLLP